MLRSGVIMIVQHIDHLSCTQRCGFDPQHFIWSFKPQE